MNDKVITIIPARYSSSRFPGKPLQELSGKPIICRVIEAVNKSVDRVIVATDDIRIFDTVVSFGYEAIMTSKKHNSGTDRIIEAFEIANNGENIIINVQGDEPFISKHQIDSVINGFNNTCVDIITLAEPFSRDTTNRDLFDFSKVKVVSRPDGKALYFSRSPIPYLRDVEDNWCKYHTYYKHIGLYAFTSNALYQIKDMPNSDLEDCEKLEQLRWLQNGLSIYVVPTEHSTIGIDTPEDLAKAELLFQKLHKQK